MTPATGTLGTRTVGRVGYGAMQLGEQADGSRRADAVALLRAAAAAGVDHIDTAQFYGDGVVNGLLAEALHPYPPSLTVVTKVGAVRVPDRNPPLAPAQHPEQLRDQVHANLRALRIDTLPVVNLRRMDGGAGIVASGDQIADLDDQLAELVALREQGLIGAIGLSNVDAEQLRRALPAGVVCVQNEYSLLDRGHEAMLQTCLRAGIAWVPFFPLGSAFADRRSVTADPTVLAHAARLDITPAQLGLAWLLDHAPNILLIPGTRSRRHLAENLAAGSVTLDDAARSALDALGSPAQRG